MPTVLIPYSTNLITPTIPFEGTGGIPIGYYDFAGNTAMRLTYSDILNQHLRMIDEKTPANPQILADFNYNFGQRYQLVQARFTSYKHITSYTFQTGINQEEYPFPPGVIDIEGGFITIGSVNYPLRPILSRWNIEQLNAIQIQASAIPQLYFVEQDSLKIWPHPQAAYTATIYYHFRDRVPAAPDINGGQLTFTNNSASVTSSDGIFTSAMVGRWLTITDLTKYGQGYWYRITGHTDSQHITLSKVYAGNTTTVSLFRIGESPELPEELHQILAWGTVSDFYAGMRKDLTNARLYNNMFWTGDPSNDRREEGTRDIMGGILGGINKYKDRDNRKIIRRKPKINSLDYKVWATTLS